MARKYLIFHTARAVVFLFYALALLMLVLLYAWQAYAIPADELIGGVILYLGVVVVYAISIDRAKRGLSQ